MPDLIEIASFLDRIFTIHLYPTDRNGIVIPSQKQILRLGLALEPWDQINEWVTKESLDALFLHRPWKLNKDSLLPGTGVIAYHLPFDEQLTIGYNLVLAEQLRLQQVKIFGEKENRPLGMIGEISGQTFTEFRQLIEIVFGSLEKEHQGSFTAVTKVAAVGAMTETLVKTAVEKGVQIYITGQFRKPAIQAVVETGIHVLAVGHKNSEVWGLHKLAFILHKQWPMLEVVLAKY